MAGLELAGYNLGEEIYRHAQTVAYSGVRLADNKPVILKTLRSDRPSLATIAALQNEYRLIQKLDFPGIIKAYDLIKHDNTFILVLEDIGGETLKQFLNNKPLDLNLFFNIAIKLTSILVNLHRNHIIHKDFNPANIIIEPVTLEIKLIDFNIASELNVESQEIINPNVLEGTLAYIAPEQTGRMNRAIDYRADFYSLGVTFYEMLTGKLPFAALDPTKLIYSHIAEMPALVSEINFNVPTILSDIVAKLMMKTPEQRYASAEGIKTDLLECQRQWLNQKKITPFPLGQYDFHEGLHISQKLYGRTNEIKWLVSAYSRVSEGEAVLFLISGYSGVGKTSLVNELQKPISKLPGYFTKGKYDQLQRSIPYSSIIKAFRELIKQILTEPEQRLLVIKQELLRALGKSGQVIIDVIPEVELIIGKQPFVENLSLAESQNRFQILFQNFLRVFTTPTHPLVLFLDDLQWADNASLKLLELLLSDPEAGYLMIIGAYRDNEVTPDHPLLLTINTLQKNGLKIEELNLKPLTQSDTNQLLADSLQSSSTDTEKLTELIFEKTAGNPFFINEFLTKLYQDKLLVFSPLNQRWQWDINKINEQNITANVIELIIGNINTLSEDGQASLKLAACIGNKFDLETLSIISEHTLERTFKNLWEAVQANLITLIGDAYKQGMVGNAVIVGENIKYQFRHDKIQQAAYNAIPEEKKQSLHFKIGELLLQQKALTEQDERLFEILYHFNKSIALISNPEERLEIAKCNLWAGRKAKSSSAYQAAYEYLKIGATLLPQDPWHDCYDLAFNLYKELVECAYLNARFQESDAYFLLLKDNANNKFDKAEAYEIEIVLYGTIGKYREAMELGLQALQLFDVNLPVNVSKLELLKAIYAIKLPLFFRDIKTLELPLMTDKVQITINRIMMTMMAVAYLYNQELSVLLICKMLSMSLKFGFSKYADFVCMSFAFVLLNLNQYKSFLAFIDLSHRLMKKFAYLPSQVKSEGVYHFFLSHWREPASATLLAMMKAYQEAMEVGDLIYAIYFLGAHANSMLDMGRPLAEVKAAAKNFLAFAIKIKTREFTDLYILMEMFVDYFLNDESITKKQLFKFEKTIEEHENKSEICNMFLVYCHAYFFLGDYAKAIEMATGVERYEYFKNASFARAKNRLYHVLALTNNYPHVSPKMQHSYFKKMKAIQRKLKRWSKWSRVNFEADYLLASAEIARLKNDTDKAAILYDQAIDIAQKNSYLHIVAMANEYAARFYLSINKTKVAKTYLLDAHYAYLRWGANTKAKLLDRNLPNGLSAKTFLCWEPLVGQ